MKSRFIRWIRGWVLCAAAMTAEAKTPTLHIIGDSTVESREGAAADQQQGWGGKLDKYFTSSKLKIENHAIGGRSSRSYRQEGSWAKVLAEIESGDYLMMQFGHNDCGSFKKDDDNGKTSLKGMGDETEELPGETVHTYGWYMKQYIREAKEKGATVIVCSPVPRCLWGDDGKCGRSGDNDYGGWSRAAAQAEGALFIDLNAITADAYNAIGDEETVRKRCFADHHTHTNAEGAELNAQCVVAGLRGLERCSLKNYLTSKGQKVKAYTEASETEAQHDVINKAFNPGAVWKDTNGEVINAHGGGMLVHEGTCYWFGEIKDGGALARSGVSCYSSKDLLQWKNEGVALKVADDPESEIQAGCIMERPKVIYNEKTQKFVMWFHLELKGQSYNAARTGVAISDSATGPYTYLRSYRPNAGVWPENVPPKFKDGDGDHCMQYLRRDLEGGQMSRDMTLFVDDDGTAYHIHSAEENYTLNISELSDDYTSFTKRWVRIAPGGHNEAPAVFKHRGKYYMITSGCTGWDPNAARLFVADRMLGEWEYLGNPCVGDDANLTFHSQSTYVLPISEKRGAYIFMADRWNARQLNDSRYIWLPIQFKGGKPTLQWTDAWNLSVFK